MAKEQRFQMSKKLGAGQIITDSETGVQYLWIEMGTAGGLTVFVDKDGKPIVSTE